MVARDQERGIGQPLTGPQKPASKFTCNGGDDMRRPLAHGICALLLAPALLATPVCAQNYPARPVRWILGFPGGGTSDILARSAAVKMSDSLGQQFVIDNRPGASGIIANELVAKSPPDGYTILLVSSTYANLISMKKKLPYDPAELAPVALVASVPNILVTHPNLPVANVKDLIALAKKRPGEINYGTGGAGTGPHLATELFKLMSGTNITHIPYKGTPPAVNDLLAGRVQVMFALSPVSMPHVKASKLKALAVSGAKRLPELPDTPTVAETVPGYEATTWYGVLVPRGTPKNIVDVLNRELAKALAMPDVAERLVAAGFQTETTTPEAFSRYIAAEAVKWRRVIVEAHIPMD
jgi:tripartite-type tricarboxylate transporter receptor subunit TctC